MIILGISCLYHDSAAALIKDGEIIAAVQEERFTRKKHDASIPINAIKYCLKAAHVCPGELDAVVYYDNPFMTANRFISNLQYCGEDNFDLLDLSLEKLIRNKLWIHEELRSFLLELGINNKLYVVEHHISHSASAFYPSPYNNAAIITIDGVGEWATTTIGYGQGNKINIIKQINYPNSIGLLYSAFTYFCGFKVNSGDYKLMGLAPYGKPIYVNLIKENLIEIKEDGSYKLNLEYFDFQNGRAMTNAKFAELFGGEKRTAETAITQREMDMAASVQKVIEDIVILLAREAKKSIGDKTDNLVLAGGVALNCVANGVLLREKIFDNIWIQPAAGDAGGALGAALYFYYANGNERTVDGINDFQKGSYLGCDFSNDEIIDYLNNENIIYDLYEDQNQLYDKIAELIAQNKVIGLFHGKMEFGPRALGNRSIIGNAQSPEMQSKLNLKIKYRESFRPFAPSVLEEDVSDYFEIEQTSPYMLLCANVKKSRCKNFLVYDERKKYEDNLLKVVNMERSDIPAVTHVDYSARIQTVNEETNSYYYGIINAVKRTTGCSVIINTSFNVRGEPIVCTPEDAYKCFMRTDMDVLVLENCVLYKENQPKFEEDNWRDLYELD